MDCFTLFSTRDLMVGRSSSAFDAKFANFSVSRGHMNQPMVFGMQNQFIRFQCRRTAISATKSIAHICIF